jgi:hypothetical protein
MASASQYEWVHKNQFEENESEQAFKLRHKIHFFLDTLCERAAYTRKKIDPRFDRYASKKKENTSYDVCIEQSLSLLPTAEINVIFKSAQKKENLTKIEEKLDGFARKNYISWDVQSHHFDPWLQTCITSVSTLKQEDPLGLNFTIIQSKQKSVAALKYEVAHEWLKGEISASRRKNKGREKRNTRNELVSFLIHEAIGLSCALPNAYCLRSGFEGLLEQYVQFCDADTFTKWQKKMPKKALSDLITFLKRENIKAIEEEAKKKRTKKKAVPYVDPEVLVLGDALSFIDKYSKHKRTFYESISAQNIEQLFLLWYLTYQRDMHEWNFILWLDPSSNQIKLLANDLEYSLKEALEPSSTPWILKTSQPVFLDFPHADQPLSQACLDIIHSLSHQRLRAIIKAYYPFYPEEELKGLKKRILNLKEIRDKKKLSGLSMQKLYNHLIGKHYEKPNSSNQCQLWPKIKIK